MNFYNATFSVVTARRARILGVTTWRSYGYYVLVSPAVTNQGRKPGRESIEAWCSCKSVAMRAKADREESQVKGYWSCPCGSNKQARACCGIPKKTLP